MRQSYDSTWDYEISDVPTEYVYYSQLGFGHVDSVEDNDTIRVTFADGRTIVTNYRYFHNKGKLNYIKLIPKETLLEKASLQGVTSSDPAGTLSRLNSESQVVSARPKPTAPPQTPLATPSQPGFSLPVKPASGSPAMRSNTSEKQVITPQQSELATSLQLNGNLVQVMLEPAEQKKMFQYLSVHEPELIEECPDPDSAVKYVMEHVFPATIQTNVIVANYCCISEATGKPIREFAIRSCDNTYLKKRLEDPNRQLKIHGLLNPSNIFRVKDIEVVSQSECTENEHHFTLRFYYPTENPRYPQRSALDEIAKLIPSYALSQEDELGLWTEYIDWKQRLAEIKVFGIKYIDYQLMETEDGSYQFHFLAVMPDNQTRARMIKLAYRERDQISVFASTVSKNQWVFVFNQENKYTNDLGLRLATIKQINIDKWASDRDSHTLNSCLSVIKNMTDEYPEPCYADISFDIPEEYEDKFAEEDYSSDQIYGFLETKLARNIPSDGFIATSHVGDFALNRRLKDALSSLRGGHAVSGNLGNWLFDIRLAHVAQAHTDIDSIEWSPWGKSRLNDSQKKMVQKMLDAPEVFLCQGPPGTGKTTVIAEAVYQFALRKKRVLIASQTNLAVNNALSKLLGYPGIRAIPLGGQGKIDSSVEHITEENILRTFYGNVKTHIQQRYFQKWHEIDASIIEPKNDQIAAHKASGQKAKGFKKYVAAIASLRQIATQIEQYNEDYDQEDSDSDLRYLQLAIEILSGSCDKEDIKVGSDDCDFLLIGLNGPLVEVQKLGYSLFLCDPGVTNLSELPRRRKAALIRNALKLFAVVNAYRHSPTSEENAECLTELESLEQKRSNLLNSTMDDYSSFLKLKEVTARINELKSQIGTSSDIVFPEELKEFLPEEYQSFVKIHGMNAHTTHTHQDQLHHCHSFLLNGHIINNKVYKVNRQNNFSSPVGAG